MKLFFFFFAFFKIIKNIGPHLVSVAWQSTVGKVGVCVCLNKHIHIQRNALNGRMYQTTI